MELFWNEMRGLEEERINRKVEECEMKAMKEKTE